MPPPLPAAHGVHASAAGDDCAPLVVRHPVDAHIAGRVDRGERPFHLFRLALADAPAAGGQMSKIT